MMPNPNPFTGWPFTNDSINPVLEAYDPLASRYVIDNCYAIRLDSGLFGVPWEKIKVLLEKGKIDTFVVTLPAKYWKVEYLNNQGATVSKEDMKAIKETGSRLRERVSYGWQTTYQDEKEHGQADDGDCRGRRTGCEGVEKKGR